MKILVINCGSSSLKYQVIDMSNESVLCKGLVERIGIDGSRLVHTLNGNKHNFEQPIENHQVAIKLVLDTITSSEVGVLKSVDEIGAIGHRVVHGGKIFTKSTKVDEKVKQSIKDCTPLSPLHNPANLMGIEACEKAMPGKPNVVVFDTSFGMGMDEKSYLYAIPYKYYENLDVRRYGFHGTSHKFVVGEAMKLGNLNKDTAKIIVCHVGNGASVSASIGGKCVDTSMGLTPLEGLIMGTRSGDLDPAIVQYIANKDNKTLDQVINILNKESGILGMSNGISSDFRDLTAAADKGNHLAQVTYDAVMYRIAKYIGAYTAALNGVDAICFTAGVGENDINLRKTICNKYLGYLGVKIDEKANDIRGEARIISDASSKVKIMLIPTNEELMIARDTLACVEGRL